MTFIANPIYDVVFKYLMEDERVAKILLSALRRIGTPRPDRIAKDLAGYRNTAFPPISGYTVPQQRKYEKRR